MKKERKQGTIKILCQEVVEFIKLDITDSILLALLLFWGWALDKWKWHFHLGIPLYTVLLPGMLGGYWRYGFKRWKENEVGSVIDKQSWLGLRNDVSNPLYAKGHFRKNYNGRMAKLRGNYFCQIIAIIQMAVILIRLIYIIFISVKFKKIGLEYTVLWSDGIIIVWVFINIAVSLFFSAYYDWIIKSERLKKQKGFYKEKEVCKKAIPNDNYDVIHYKNTLDYITMLYDTVRGFRDCFQGEGKLLFGQKTNMKHNLIMDIEENRDDNSVQILVQMYQKRLTREYVDMMNRFIHKEIRYASQRSLPFGFPHVTYIIYVEEKSKLFEDIFCGTIHQRKSFHCLPIGIVLNEEKMYIPGIRKGNAFEEYQKMKAKVFEIFEELSLMYPSTVVFKEELRKRYKKEQYHMGPINLN